MCPSSRLDFDSVSRLAAAGKTDAEIASELSVSKSGVKKFRTRHGIMPGVSRGASSIDIRLAESLITAGKSNRDVALEVGCKPDTVSALRKKLGLRSWSEIRRESKSADVIKKPLVKPDIETIRGLVEAGKTDKEISMILGLSYKSARGHVRRSGIRRRQAYSPVDIDQNAVRELSNRGLLDHEVAASLNATSAQVYSCRKRYGIPSPAPKLRTSTDAVLAFGLPDWVCEWQRRILVALLDGPKTVPDLCQSIGFTDGRSVLPRVTVSGCGVRQECATKRLEKELFVTSARVNVSDGLGEHRVKIYMLTMKAIDLMAKQGECDESQD